MSERNRLIITLDPGQGVEPAIRDFASRSQWRQALIENRQALIKPITDGFCIWLQQPDQEQLLDNLSSFKFGKTMPYIVADFNPSVSFDSLRLLISKYPDVKRVTQDQQIELIELVSPSR